MLPFYQHQRQMINHALDADRFYLLWAGSIRTGKSLGSAYAMLAHMKRYYNQAGVDYLLGGHTSGSAIRNVVPYIMRLARYYRMPCHYRSGANPSIDVLGNRIHIFGGDKETSQDKIQGMTVGMVFIDELTRVTQSFYDMATTRASLPNAVILATMNKDSEYHWTAQDVYYPIRDGLMNGHIVEAKVDDATGMPDEFFKDVRSGLPAFRQQRLLDNEFAEAEGLVYPHFTIQNPPANTKPDLHIVGVDWGMKGVTAGVRLERYGDAWYVVDEYYHTGRVDGELTAGEHAGRILTQLGGWQWIVVDPSASVLIYALNKLTSKVQYAQNDVIEGIQSVDAAFRRQQLFVSTECPQLLRELSTYVWKDTIEKPEKKNDHAVDALRYAIMEILPLEYATYIAREDDSRYSVGGMKTD